VSIGDNDGDLLTVTITAADGTLWTREKSGSTITFVDSAKALRSRLSILTFFPTEDFSGDTTITFSASDGTVTTTEVLLMRVLDDGEADVNDEPQLSLSVLSPSLSESADTSSAIRIADITVTDDALGTNELILEGEDAELFEIVGDALYLVAGATLDAELDASLNVVVNVDDDTVGASPDASVTLNITVVDANESPVVDDGSFTIDENAAAGTVLGTVVASDPDGDTLGFTLIDSPGTAGFAIDPVTGELSVADASVLDFETAPVITLFVQVADDGSPSLTSAATVTVNLNDINDAPTIEDALFTISEDAAAGTVVGSVTAGDADDGDEVTLSIVSGNDSGAFAIDSQTGEITVADSSTLDFEAAPQLVLVVEASDSESLTATGSVTIDLLDADEAPAVTADQPTVTVDEGGRGTLGGSFADQDTGDAVTLTAVGEDGTPVGSIVQDIGGSGAWSWSFDTSDGPVESRQVTVTATDVAGNATQTTFDLVVNNVAPTAAIVDAPTDVLYTVEPFSFVASFADPGTGDSHTVQIDWGDGVVEPASFDPLTGVINGSHAYAGGGIYEVAVTVTDHDGASGTASFIVEVLSPLDAAGDLDDRLMVLGLDNGVQNSLRDSLSGIAQALGGKKVQVAKALNKLNEFVAKLDGYLGRGTIDQAVYDELFGRATVLRESILALS
jgi:hypothetical protein